MNINEEYQEIISKCKFISKNDEWFDEGTEAILGSIYTEFKDSTDKFNYGSGLWSGWVKSGWDDCESCSLDEFFIYDEHGNEISELTLTEYKEKYK